MNQCKNTKKINKTPHSRSWIIKHIQYLEYWVVFPQGITEYENNITTYSHEMTAKTIREAFELMEKYGGAYILKMAMTQWGRFGLNLRSLDPIISEKDFWIKYRDLPEVIIDRRTP
jgi:hypothetical protein